MELGLHPVTGSVKEKAEKGTLQKRQTISTREGPGEHLLSPSILGRGGSRGQPPEPALEAAERVRGTYSGAHAPGVTLGSVSHWLCEQWITTVPALQGGSEG